MMEETVDKYCYVYSCDLDVNIKIKIGTLEGKRVYPSYKQLIADPILSFSGACQDGCSDLYVTCQLYAGGRPLALPTRTSYKAFGTRWNWNEWLRLPVHYNDLPRDAQFAFTIWDVYAPREAIPVGGTTVSVFGKHGTIRQGMHDLRVWPGVQADGGAKTATPAKTKGKHDDMGRLAKLSKRHRGGHIAKVDWLDRLTFREIELINEKEKRNSNFMYLMVEFPRFHRNDVDFSAVYYEMGGDEMQHAMPSDVSGIPDAEIQMENLIESKHHKLARSLRSGPIDRDLKPNAATRDQLNVIVGYPPTKTLSSEELDLVWKFRFYLSSQKTALTKFLKSVTWSVREEAQQALELTRSWSPMDVEDALELLSPAFTHPAVRRYAVKRLQQADDEALLLYLLQLVQALKYENFDEINAAYQRQVELNAATSRKGSMSSTTPTTPYADVDDACLPPMTSPTPMTASCSRSSSLSEPIDEPRPTERDSPLEVAQPEMDLTTFLISRACRNPMLANYLCWYLMTECDDQEAGGRDTRFINMYILVLKMFSLSLSMEGGECQKLKTSIAGQQVFMEKLVKLVKLVASESGNRKRKIEKLQSLLVDPEALRFNFVSFDPIPLPLDPEVTIVGIVAEEATLFKSAMMPCRFTFRTTTGKNYVTIFKHGDDLRQDQLVLQIITLMDKLLQTENLDLKLTPYKVLATSTKHGFVQFIESTAVAEVLAVDGSILNYFRKHAPSEHSPYGVAPEVIDNYIKSCAGYCVITYLLGVGDRHLDNLLLTTSGTLFHIDFGYILGRDPKPMPPPMKLTKEMVEAMGGVTSEHFTEFRKLCYTAFLHLRRSANLILNLFSLMVDTNVPDIAIEPDKTVRKVQEKFRLDLTDEEAVHYMQSLLDASGSATVAAFMEQMHKIAQYWRK